MLLFEAPGMQGRPRVLYGQGNRLLCRLVLSAFLALPAPAFLDRGGWLFLVRGSGLQGLLLPGIRKRKTHFWVKQVQSRVCSQFLNNFTQ